MIISALSSQISRTTRQLACFVRHWLIPSNDSANNHLTPVDPYRCHRRHPSLQHVAMRVSAFAALMVFAPVTQAIAQQDNGGVTGLEEDLTKLSPELARDQWGWHLTRYWEFAGSYKIDGQPFLMLSMDLSLTDNVLWDPLTGFGSHLDHKQWVQFTAAHRQDKFVDVLAPGQGLDLSRNRTVIDQPAPGVGMPSCGPIFNDFFEVYESSHNLLRSFYAVAKVVDPLSVKYHICIEGGGYVDTKPDIEIEFATGLTFIGSLTDSTLLIVAVSKSDATVVRLDRGLQQHTSVGGRLFVLDAAGINAGLESLADIQDPTSRYRVFIAAIEAARKSGLY
jgi:hypothetical protein